MFTGLISECGTLVELTAQPESLRLTIAATFAEVELGESIAVDGVCLTVTAAQPGRFEVQAAQETLRCTTLGDVRVGQSLHLERALRLGDRLGGHFVSGHVDGIGHVAERNEVGDALRLRYALPPALRRFVAPKGSITVDGVSLTVNFVDAQGFELMLVPYTRRATHLDGKTVGDAVNLEVDLLARYVLHALDVDAANAPTAPSSTP